MQEMENFQIDRSRYDEASKIENKFESNGLNEELVRFISKEKNEPEWMLKKRLQGFSLFNNALDGFLYRPLVPLFHTIILDLLIVEL